MIYQLVLPLESLIPVNLNRPIKAKYVNNNTLQPLGSFLFFRPLGPWGCFARSNQPITGKSLDTTGI